MRGTGGIAVTLVALLLGILVVSQFRSQDVFTRSLQLETPASLTTLVAGLAVKNDNLRDEIFDLRLRLEAARDSIASGKGSLDESERQMTQLKIFGAQSGARGPGISIKVDGTFDDRALADLMNELRNAGAEAIAVNDRRVGPRSFLGAAAGGTLAVDNAQVAGPWMVRAIGSPDTLYVAITRTGGIVEQFQLIYQRTRFTVAKEPALELPPLR